MTKGVEQLAQKLIDQIFTAFTLKVVSDTLEDISQNKSFKEHATSIATDPALTKTQKKTQLTYLLRSIEVPLIHQFFLDQFDQQQFWLFSGGRIDYFDRFVQAFQRQTENIEVIQLETAVELNQTQIKKIATDLSESFNIKVIINHEVKESMTAGFKIKVENIIYDYSLHTKYMQFQKSWISSLKKTEKVIGRNIPD